MGGLNPENESELMDNDAKLSPMMAQYKITKASYQDCLLFYRLGDFYEMFFDDALVASRELELTLTGRSCGEGEKAPMCGVPFHAAEAYIERLVKRGYKVAICEQMEDPKLMKSQGIKGLVPREITRVVTPGTSMSVDSSQEGKNNYIVCVYLEDGRLGLSACDITTGEFLTTEFSVEESDDNSFTRLMDELSKYQPAEIVYNELDTETELFKQINRYAGLSGAFLSAYGTYHYQLKRSRETVLTQFCVAHLAALGLEKQTASVCACGALLDYLQETQKRQLGQISHIQTYSTEQYMVLDTATRRNLELVETLRDKERKGSLLWVLDYTRCAMGARMLRRFIEQPLLRQEEVQRRLDMVEAFTKVPMLSGELKELLNGIYDMERLIGRINYGSANARDLVALRQSLSYLPPIRTLLLDAGLKPLTGLAESLDTLDDLYTLLQNAIAEDPPFTLREGGLIKPGYNADVDIYRSAAVDGKSWLAQLEAKEREQTGIKNLRVGYTRIFGYYIEVSKGNVGDVPDRYIRRQTLTTGERFVTQELKEMENTLLSAKEKDESLEYEIFQSIRQKMAENTERIQKAADVVASVDALRSLAEAAFKNRYVKPTLTAAGGQTKIKAGRHPVVERMLEIEGSEKSFIANDTDLGSEDCRLAIITGPNMAGKSTYMRQVALITLMAQAGSFVPADEATISMTDHIFTRIGASDDLAGGQSTFMTEMTEVSNILRHASRSSLLILDEIGRGTSTYDGLSIAQAVVEFILENVGAKTLFATHYHELTELENTVQGLKNYCVAVKETPQGIIFLHKICEGAGNQSYGIEVARLAGLPEELLSRASRILSEILNLSDEEYASRLAEEKSRRQSGLSQLELFVPDGQSASRIEQALSEMDADSLSPREALEKLYELKKML